MAKDDVAHDIYVICVSDDTELLRARDHAAKTFPGSRVVQELPLARLTEEHALAAVFTRNGTLTNSKPIACADHWRPSSDSGGTIDARSLLGALAPQCVPAIVKYRDGVLRLGYA